MDSKPVIREKLLVVEGKDEHRFMKCVLEKEGIQNVEIIMVGGNEKFKAEIHALVENAGFQQVRRLGFVRDAEKRSPASAMQSVITNLENAYAILAEESFPSTPDPWSKPSKAGEVVIKRDYGLGVFVMPDNSNPGMLEDLCLASVADLPELDLADHYLCQASQLIAARDDPIKHDQIQATFKKAYSKRLVQAYLASYPDQHICNSIRVGAMKGVWPHGHAVFKPLCRFLHSLYD